jgi:hypothetical protein
LAERVATADTVARVVLAVAAEPAGTPHTLRAKVAPTAAMDSAAPAEPVETPVQPALSATRGLPDSAAMQVQVETAATVAKLVAVGSP